MEQETTTTETGAGPETRELLRPREGRVLAGISQGLANRFEVPAWLPRLIFVITAFFGGLGVAMYLAGWALIRAEDETESPAERFFSGASSSRAWIGVGFIFIAALILLDNFTFFSGGVVFAAGLLIVGVLLYLGQIPLGSGSGGTQSKEGVQQMTTTDTTIEEAVATETGDSPAGGSTAAPPPPPPPAPTPPLLPPRAAKPKERSILGRLTVGVTLLALGVLAVLDNIEAVNIDAEPRHYLALAVTVVGLGLVVGSIWGRARWLILASVILVPTLLFSPVFEYDWNSETFDASHHPTSFEEVDSNYSIDVGNLQIDLTDLPWNGQEIQLKASVDAGNLEIWIPSDVGIIGEASTDVGRVGTRGRESAGIGNPSLRFDSEGSSGTVIIDLHVDLGNIQINRTGG